MSTLLNHCGASRISLDGLSALDNPVPYTDTHYPIRHDVFIELAKDTLTRGGYLIKTEEYSLIQEEGKKDNMFGLLTLENGHADTGRVVGLRNSGSRDFTAQLGCGGHVFVCDNLVFTAAIVVGRKHTRYIMNDLPVLMNDAVKTLGDEFQRQQVRQEIYKETRISDEVADHITKEAMRLKSPKGIPGSSLPAWDKEYRNPRHPQFEYKTAWGLQNAFTEVAKKWNFDTMQNRTEGLIQVMDKKLNFEEQYLDRVGLDEQVITEVN